MHLWLMATRFFYLIPIFFQVLFTGAQEKLGIANSNYHPISSIHLNPSTSSDSRAYLQFNLIGVNIFAKTNMAYLPDFSYLSAYRSRSFNPQPDTRKNKKFMYANFVADGPTFIISKRNYGAGIFVRARSVLDARRIPYELSEIFLGLRNPGDFAKGKYGITNAKLSNMSWIEYGLNFSGMAKKKNKTLITVGGNLKCLTGINIFYANLRKLDAEYTSSIVHIDTVNAIVKYNQPAFKSGKGYGLDIGVTYKKMLDEVDYYYANSKRSLCNYKDYKYKIGVSLRDAGYIKFRSNTTMSELNGSGQFFTQVQDTNLGHLLQQRFSLNIIEGQRITAFTPASLSGQIDYNFETGVFLNVTLIKTWFLTVLLAYSHLIFWRYRPVLR